MKFKSLVMALFICSLAFMFLVPMNAIFAEEYKVIRFGLIPSEDADKLIADSQPFIEQLEKTIGLPIKPYVALDYSAVWQKTRLGAKSMPSHAVLWRRRANLPIRCISSPNPKALSMTSRTLRERLLHLSIPPRRLEILCRALYLTETI